MPADRTLDQPPDGAPGRPLDHASDRARDHASDQARDQAPEQAQGTAGEPPRTDGRRLRYQHRRPELLAAATEHVLRHGLDGLTLRRVADSAGVTHAALLHHFSSRSQLVEAVVREVLDRAFTDTAAQGRAVDEDPGAGPLRALWRRSLSPDGQALVRAFLAVTGSAVYDEELAVPVRASVQDRVRLIAAGLVAAGCPVDQAPATATLVLSTMRGLATDRLLTGDGARVDAAFEAFVQGIEARQRGWGAPG